MKKVILLFTVILALFLSSCAKGADTTGDNTDTVPEFVQLFCEESEYVPLFGHRYYVVGEITDYYCNMYDGINNASVKDSYITIQCGDELLTVKGYSVGEGCTVSSAQIESSQYLLLDDSINGKTAVVFFSETDSLPVIWRDDVLIADDRGIYHTPAECIEQMRGQIEKYTECYRAIPDKIIDSPKQALIYTANKMGYTDLDSVDLQGDRPCLYLNQTDYLKFLGISCGTGDESYSSEIYEYPSGKYPVVEFTVALVSENNREKSYSLNIDGKYFQPYIDENGEHMTRMYDNLPD